MKLDPADLNHRVREAADTRHAIQSRFCPPESGTISGQIGVTPNPEPHQTSDHGQLIDLENGRQLHHLRLLWKRVLNFNPCHETTQKKTRRKAVVEARRRVKSGKLPEAFSVGLLPHKPQLHSIDPSPSYQSGS